MSTRSLTALLAVLLFLLTSATASVSLDSHRIVPPASASDRVNVFDGVYFQATATPARGQNIRFHVVITGAASEPWIKDSLQLRQWPFADRKGMAWDGPYPDIPKIKAIQNGDTVTCDFTLPSILIKDPRLAVTITKVHGPHPAASVYFAVLKEFAGDGVTGPTTLAEWVSELWPYALFLGLSGLLTLFLWRRRRYFLTNQRIP